MSPRLMPGENPKIDKINALVLDARSEDREISNDGITALLQVFKPMLLGLCKKWSQYFNDDKHYVKSFDDLMVDAQYWFTHYTLYVYTIDGLATYNKFIKDHVDQRIRYIYECELKYYSKNLFPDPNKNIDNDVTSDILEDVIHKYSSSPGVDVEYDYINKSTNNSRIELAHYLLSLLNNQSIFSDRERLIFTEIMYNGITHDQMGIRLNVSRTRITQILRKTKNKLYKLMENNQHIWDLIDDGDINIEEGKW